jgi:hypothetical protein
MARPVYFQQRTYLMSVATPLSANSGHQLSAAANSAKSAISWDRDPPPAFVVDYRTNDQCGKDRHRWQ